MRHTVARLQHSPAMGPKPPWFQQLFGFEEEASFANNRERFSMDGDVLVCESSQYPRQHVGQFETASLAELRARCAEGPPSDASQQGLQFANMAAPEGVVPLILDPANAGAVFQAVGFV